MNKTYLILIIFSIITLTSAIFWTQASEHIRCAQYSQNSPVRDQNAPYNECQIQGCHAKFSTSPQAIAIADRQTYTCVPKSSTTFFKLSSSTNLLRVCPDALVANRMPRSIPDPPSTTPPQKNTYYILNDKRREIEEFDNDWITSNCQVPRQEVF